MATFTYEFDELPLVIAKDGTEAGYINGCVELTFDRSATWEVFSVAIEGHQKLTAEERVAGKKPWVYVEAPDAIADIIVDRLLGEWNDRVTNAVIDAIEGEREAAAERRAEMRRDERMGI